MDFIPNEQQLAGYLSGECAENEAKQIELWMNADPENRKMVEDIKALWDSKSIQSEDWTNEQLWLKIIKDWNKRELWSNIANETGIETAPNVKPLEPATAGSKVFGSSILKVAAVLLIVLSLPYFYSKITNPSGSVQQAQNLEELKVELGTRTKITLSDGTIVTLDAGTTLRYPKEFTAGSREVMLEGEGYFEVAENKDKPFVVRTGGAVIRVLGTKFNVRSWENSRNTKVAVVEGRVSLQPESSDQDEGIVLTAGQLGILDPDKNMRGPFEVNAENHIGWMNKEADFEDTPLREILNQLERWYNIEITLSDTSLASERLAMHISAGPLDNILTVVAELTDTEFERSNGKVHFRSR